MMNDHPFWAVMAPFTLADLKGLGPKFTPVNIPLAFEGFYEH